MSPCTYSTSTPLRLRFGAGPIEEQLARVDAGDAEAARRERVRDAAVPARAVEDLGAGLELEQPDDRLDVAPPRARAKHRLVEVEVVLVEDALEVELAHLSARNSSMQHVHLADALEAEPLEDRARHRPALRDQRGRSVRDRFLPARVQNRAVRAAAARAR